MVTNIILFTFINNLSIGCITYNIGYTLA